ncbi:MAG: NAD-dependent epimerase/dehydratase family protein, partial [Tannerella sp.]|nr:NAD-dependent epimerase/dehydratase family protein [Tannerella sp.]
MKILITGSAGFIGFHLVKRLVKSENIEIIGVDNINDYYDINLKYARLQQSGIRKELIRPNRPAVSAIHPNYSFYQTDIVDYAALYAIYKAHRIDAVINMAAQAGVRYSIENPHIYIQSNVAGFTNILECCRHFCIKHLIYASSSSVYGISNQIPFSEDDNTNYPVSVYAATKKSNELLAHSYSHLFHIPTTGVRLFTVYGPWGRPDMAPILFAESIIENKPVKIFNQGNMSRDFTYISDIVDGICNLIDHRPDGNVTQPYYRIFNIGNSKPVQLLDFISILENAIGQKAHLEKYPMQPGDIPVTYADTSKLNHIINYRPQTTLNEGIPVFVEWFKDWKQYKED